MVAHGGSTVFGIVNSFFIGSCFDRVNLQTFRYYVSDPGLSHPLNRGTQREYSSKPLKHSTVKRTLVFKTVDIGIFSSPKNFSSVRIS